MKKIFEIMLTNMCNARCAYCYEDARHIKTMNRKTQEETVQFVNKKVDQDGEVVLVWFGGEPLLFPQAIEELQGRIVESLQKKQVKLTTKLITNGSRILTHESLHLFSTGQIDIVQVSMDGYGDEHMKRKQYVDEGLTFEKIIEGIERLLAIGLIVSVRINLGRKNLESCARLSCYLEYRFRNCKNLRIHPAVLYGSWSDVESDYLGPNEIEGAIQLVNGNSYATRKTTCSSYSCFSGYETYVIDPCGRIYPCEHLLEMQRFELVLAPG